MTKVSQLPAKVEKKVRQEQGQGERGIPSIQNKHMARGK